LRNPLG